MADIVDPATRSRMMAGIRGKDTRPEMRVRQLLHAAGFRYRLHGRKLPGKPDLVLARHNAVVFVHGCFWHGHRHCRLFRLPASRREFWETKIGSNIARDTRDTARLLDAGWTVAVVWECAIKGPGRLADSQIVEDLASHIRSGTGLAEIRGSTHDSVNSESALSRTTGLS